MFKHILSGLFVCQPACLNCKHAASLAESKPKGASTLPQTHTVHGIDEKWPFCAPFFFFKPEFLLLMHALWLFTRGRFHSMLMCLCVCGSYEFVDESVRALRPGCVKNDACHRPSEMLSLGERCCAKRTLALLWTPSRPACGGPLGAL